MKFKRFVEEIRKNHFSRFFARRLIWLLHGSSALDTMLASEDVLRRDWDTPEEDIAWSHL